MPQRTLARSGAWVVAGHLVATVTAFGSTVLLARALGAAAYGVYVLLASLAGVLAALSRLGLHQLVVRATGRATGRGRTEDADGAVRTCVLLASLGGAAAAALVASPWAGDVVLSVFDVELPLELRLLVALWLFADGVRLVATEAMRGRGEVAAATLLGDAARNVALLLLLAALLTGAASIRDLDPDLDLDLDLAVLCAAASSALLLGLVLLVLSRELRTRPSAPLLPLGGVLRTAAPLAGTGLAVLVLAQAGTWATAAVLDPADVADYGVATRLAVLLAVPLVLVDALTSPVVAAAAGRGDAGAAERPVRGAVTAAAVPTLLGLLLVIAAPGAVVDLLVGAGYGGAALPLQILAVGHAVHVLTGPCGVALIMWGQERLVLLAAAVATPVALAGAVAVAPSTGVAGVALVVGTTLAAQDVVLALLCRRRLGFWTTPTLRGDDLRSFLRSVGAGGS